jgi:hypothetical protein
MVHMGRAPAQCVY